MDDRRQARLLRGGEGRGEIGGVLDLHAEATEGFGVGDEVRVLQRGRDHAARIIALLVHADGAVEPVVMDHDDHRQLVLHGGGEILPGHHEVAVAGDADHRALGMDRLDAERRRKSVTHRARGRADMGGVFAETIEAVNPAGEIARAIGEE